MGKSLHGIILFSLPGKEIGLGEYEKIVNIYVSAIGSNIPFLELPSQEVPRKV